MLHIKKQLNLVKNSFTLIEVLSSLIIISVIILGFSNIIISNNKKDNYEKLNIAYDNFLDNKAISTKDIIFNEHK